MVIISVKLIAKTDETSGRSVTLARRWLRLLLDPADQSNCPQGSLLSNDQIAFDADGSVEIPTRQRRRAMMRRPLDQAARKQDLHKLCGQSDLAIDVRSAKSASELSFA